MRQNGGSGDDELFRSLYTRHYARTLRFFRKVFRVSTADAQELAQDVFVRLYKAIGEYRGDSEWALVETIARNVGYNYIRARTTIKRGAVRAESLDSRESEKEPAAVQIDPVDRLIEAERVTRLRHAVAELPKGQRHCLRLWLHDFSYEEIARALDISIEAVRSRVRDAKRSLRTRLGDEGVLPED